MTIVTNLFIYNESKEMISPTFIELIENKGVKGDKHFGDRTKQVVIADKTVYENIKNNDQRGLCFKRFKANIIVDHFAAADHLVGSKLNFGEAILEVTAHKPCFADDCKLAQLNDYCPLKNGIVFAKVIRSGIINVASVLFF